MTPSRAFSLYVYIYIKDIKLYISELAHLLLLAESISHFPNPARIPLHASSSIHRQPHTFPVQVPIRAIVQSLDQRSSQSVPFPAIGVTLPSHEAVEFLLLVGICVKKV